jgi:hypothetical protein
MLTTESLEVVPLGMEVQMSVITNYTHYSFNKLLYMVICTTLCAHTTFHWYYIGVPTHVSDNFYIVLYMLQTTITTSCNYKFSNIQFQHIFTSYYSHKISVYISFHLYCTIVSTYEVVHFSTFFH